MFFIWQTFWQICKNLAKVISNRPGVSVAGATPGSTIPDVGVYGSNSNLGAMGNAKINVDSRWLNIVWLMYVQFRTCSKRGWWAL